MARSIGRAETAQRCIATLDDRQLEWDGSRSSRLGSSSRKALSHLLILVLLEKAGKAPIYLKNGFSAEDRAFALCPLESVLGVGFGISLPLCSEVLNMVHPIPAPIRDLISHLRVSPMKKTNSVPLSSDLLEEIDTMAGTNVSRSEFIERALRTYLGKRRRQEAHTRDLERINAAADELNDEAADVLKFQHHAAKLPRVPSRR